MATKKRLIDANSLVLENSILMEDEYGLPFKCVLEEDIRYAPTVDAVEVVRCKDCKYQNEDGDCEIHDEWTTREPDSFCCYGERKDGG